MVRVRVSVRDSSDLGRIEVRHPSVNGAPIYNDS